MRPVSWVVEVDVAADRRGDGVRIAFAGADDEISAPEGTFDDAKQRRGAAQGASRDPQSPRYGS